MNRRIKTHAGGFTIIEVIVIVVIIGVIAAVVAPRLIGRIGQSKQAIAKSNASNLASQINLFRADHGALEDGATIDILFERPSNVAEDKYEPYVQSAESLMDPWGRKFVLRLPGVKNRDFDVVSYGADGEEGGEGENADVVAP